MKGVVILCVCVATAMCALLPEHHQTAQDMCGSLPDLSFLKSTQATEETKAKLLPHLKTVCDIYHKYYIKPNTLSGAIRTRGLLDGLSGLVGQDSKLGTLLKAADALSKAKGVFDEVKQLAPAVHDHIKGGIQDVHDGLQELLDSITNEFMGSTLPPTKSF